MKRIIIDRYVLGQQATNCYLIWDTASKHALIVDPADDGGFLTEELSRLSLTLDFILLTHGHFDHLLGLLELVLATQTPVFVHSGDTFLLKRAQKTAQHFLGVEVDPLPDQFVALTGSELLALSQDGFQVLEGKQADASESEKCIGHFLHLPGHTPGCIGLVIGDEENKKHHSLSIGYNNDSFSEIILIGDTLLPEEKTDLSHGYSRFLDWQSSIKMVENLPENCLVFPGHGEIFPLSFYNLSSRFPEA